MFGALILPVPIDVKSMQHAPSMFISRLRLPLAATRQVRGHWTLND